MLKRHEAAQSCVFEGKLFERKGIFSFFLLILQRLQSVPPQNKELLLRDRLPGGNESVSYVSLCHGTPTVKARNLSVG